MLVPLKTVLGLLASTLTVLVFFPYLIDTLKGKSKPHLYTWLIWSCASGISFFGSFLTGGESGSWHIGIAFLLCSLTAVVSIKYGTKNISILDKLCLFLALFAMVLWIIVRGDPFWPVILAVAIDLIAYFPTFRKSYTNPYTETMSLYYVGIVIDLIGLCAISKFSLTTYLYPASIIVANVIFISFIKVRKRYAPVASTVN